MERARDPERSRLLWRCRRGRRELDLLLQQWMDRHFEAATVEQRARFAELLELPDPELERYLIGLGGALPADLEAEPSALGGI